MTADEILLIQVRVMSELERQSFVEKLVELLSKDHQLHLISNCYEFEDPEVEELRDEVFDLEQQIKELEFDKKVLEDKLEKVITK